MVTPPEYIPPPFVIEEYERFLSNYFEADWTRQTIQEFQKQGFWEHLFSPIREALERIWDSLKEKIGEIWDAIKDRIEAIFSPIWTGLQNLWDTLREKLSDLWDSIKSIPSWIWDHLKAGFEWIRDHLAGLWDKFKAGFEWLRDKLHDVWDALVRFGQWVYDGLKSVWETLKGIPGWLKAHVYEPLRNLASEIRERLSNLWTTIREGFYSFIGEVREKLSWLWSEIKDIGHQIKIIVQEGLPWFWNQLKHFFGELAEDLKIIAVYTLNTMADWMMKLYNAIVVNFYAPFIYFAGDLVRLSGRATELAKYIIDEIMSAIGYEGPATFEKARQAMYRYMGIVLGWTVHAFAFRFAEKIGEGILSWALTLTRATGGMGGGQGEIGWFFQQLAWVFGLNWLSWIIFGGLFRAAIAEPLEQEWRYRYRTEFPTRSMVDGWLRTGLISEEEATHLYQRMGWRDEFIPYIIKSAYNYPSFSMLEDFVAWGYMTAEQAYTYVPYLGYAPEVRPLVYSYLVQSAMKERYSRIMTKWGQHVAKGYMTYDEAIVKASQFNINPVYAQTFFQSYELELEEDIKDEEVDAYTDLFRKNLIDEDTYRILLARVIKDPRKIESKVFREKVRKLPKERIPDARSIDEKIRDYTVQLDNLKRELNWLAIKRKEALDVYNARIEYYKARMESEIHQIETETKARIERMIAQEEAIQRELIEEFEAWGERTVSELEARIRYYERLMKTVSPEEAERYAARIELLRELTVARIEERRARLEAYLKRRQAVLEARIKEIEERAKARIEEIRKTYSARIKVLQEQAEKTDTYYAERIDKVKEKIAELEEEINVLVRIADEIRRLEAQVLVGG